MKKITFAVLMVMGLIVFMQASTLAGETCRIIKKTAIIHCQRGVERCQKCREMYAEKYCLLDLCPKNAAARRVTEIVTGGKKEWREFDIIRQFDSYEDAAAYGKKEGITVMIEKPGAGSGTSENENNHL